MKHTDIKPWEDSDKNDAGDDGNDTKSWHDVAIDRLDKVERSKEGAGIHHVATSRYQATRNKWYWFEKKSSWQKQNYKLVCTI